MEDADSTALKQDFCNPHACLIQTDIFLLTHREPGHSSADIPELIGLLIGFCD